MIGGNEKREKIPFDYNYSSDAISIVWYDLETDFICKSSLENEPSLTDIASVMHKLSAFRHLTH